MKRSLERIETLSIKQQELYNEFVHLTNVSELNKFLDWEIRLVRNWETFGSLPDKYIGLERLLMECIREVGK